MASSEIDSILNSIKKKLGSNEMYEYFDHDILTEINSNFATLYQVGVGSSLFVIESEDDTWDDYVEGSGIRNRHVLEFVKEYVFLGTRLIFDPPESSSLMEALKAKKEELEWRIYLDEDLLKE